MKIIAISEHYFPRVGGTVEYVHQTCSALSALGFDVCLLVPGTAGVDAGIDREQCNYQVHRLDVGWPLDGDPNRKARYQFCDAVSEYVSSAVARKSVDVVHVLFGLFINETLDTAILRAAEVFSVTTVHNVPPQECGRSWPGDGWAERMKDLLRLQLVSLKNRMRLKRHLYDAYVVPSNSTGQLLRNVLPGRRIDVVGHGVSENLLAAIDVPVSRIPTDGGALRLLTLGGIVPHKRQHVIPAVAESLRKGGLDFLWTIAGPASRVGRYFNSIQSDIEKRGLGGCVRVSDALSRASVAKEYSLANLYVQPSIEEGFCITALDAAASGIPVIGSPAGAIPEICQISQGVLVASEVDAVANAVLDYAKNRSWPADCRVVASRVCEEYTWLKAAERLSQIYCDLAGGHSFVTGTGT